MIKYFFVTVVIILLGMLGNLSAKPYKGAELRTNESFLYGRFEVRMKSAAGSGLLSSFFTYHDTPNIPAQWNEIDIEILGRYSDEVQYNIITQGQVNHVVEQAVKFNPHQAFHVYAIEWTPDYVAWQVDGFEIYRETASHVQQLFYAQKNMMNIWLPDNPGWVGNFDPAILPVYAYYDWVKYYEYTPGSNNNFTLQWTDDFNLWNQGRWSKGNHTWNGNNCDLIPQNAVFQDGYLILCLTDAVNIGYSGDPVEDTDNTPPYLVWARAYSDHVKVFFSEALDPASAENAANYILPPLNITNATLLNDNRTVRLDVENLDPNVPYNLIVSGIKDLAQPPNTMNTAVIITIRPLQFPVHINIAGSTWQNYLEDQVWTHALEYGYTGGSVINHSPTLQINNTEEDEVYRAELRDPTFYQVRLPEGQYDVTLMFAETQFNSPSSRIFNVYAEGQLVIENLNIFGEAGLNMNTAVEKTIESLQVSDGVLELYFQGVVGDPVISGIKITAAPTAITETPPAIPAGFEWSIYPNPFNPAATIEYSLQRAENVEIELYDIQGRLVKRLMSEYQPAGAHLYRFDAGGLSSGVYFFAIKTGAQAPHVKKAVFLK